jgi:hypothetical protein
MPISKAAPTRAQASLLQWIADVGAVTAPALATLQATSVGSARARLAAAGRVGLVTGERPLAGEASIYTLSPAGLRRCGLCAAQAVRVTPANAPHLIACTEVAAALACRYPDHGVIGEGALRRFERQAGTVLASAVLGRGLGGEPQLHRPDLVLWPLAGTSLPVAVEVELTIKAPRRLVQICRAWARCREVAGVLYLAAPPVELPLARAIAEADAAEAIVALPLGAASSREPAVPEHRTGAGAAARTVADSA